VEIIEKRYPQAYRRAKEKTYAKCMAELPPGVRRDLVARYVDRAKINWAHIGIAQLMKNGYVDRILTTNFDLLAVRACAMLGVFPAIYDFAASQLFKPADIPDQAVFYLHGQRTGFVLMNTEEELEKHAKLLAPVFEDAGRGRIWVVVGYSGENDPVFDHLAKVDRFDHCLFWAGYGENDPATHVRERLLADGKYAFYVKGFDADDFFVTLAQKLGCFPPDLTSKPFSHLNALLEVLTPYSIPGQSGDVDVTEEARSLIQNAVEQYEKPTRKKRGKRRPPVREEVSSATLAALKNLMAGDYEKVIALGAAYKGTLPAELADYVRRAYGMQGNALSNEAKIKDGEEADRLFALASEKYQAAVNIKPDDPDTLSNWGTALTDQAKIKDGEEADRLFALAAEKYQAAFKLRPGHPNALYNRLHLLACGPAEGIAERLERSHLRRRQVPQDGPRRRRLRQPPLRPHAGP
jgi:tetratricopeptide (TPR) repeat protein